MTETLGIIDASLEPSHSQALDWRLFAGRRLGGQPLLEWIVRRTTEAEQLRETVVLTGRSSEELVRSLAPANVEVIVSSGIDSLSRFAETARLKKAQSVVRVRLDCPFVDPVFIDGLCSSVRQTAGVDFATYCLKSGGMAAAGRLGLFAEWIAASALERADRRAVRPSERVTASGFILAHPEMFQMRLLTAPEQLEQTDWNLQLGAGEDWDRLQTIFEAAGTDRRDWSQIAALAAGNAGRQNAMAAIPQKAA